MTAEGPELDRLTHRLSECPPEILSAALGGAGVDPEAVVHDLWLDLGGELLPPAELREFRAGSPDQANRLRLVLIACWLLHDSWFRERGGLAQPARRWLEEELGDLAELLRAELFVTDPERREELVRLALQALDLRPRGESEAAAADRLTTLDSRERESLLQATREKQAQAQKLREKMQAKRAREAAAKASREW